MSSSGSSVGDGVTVVFPHAALTTHPRSKEFDRDNVSVAISYVDRYSCRNPFDVSGDRLLVVSSVAIYLAVKMSESVKLAVRAIVSDNADEHLYNMP